MRRRGHIWTHFLNSDRCRVKNKPIYATDNSAHSVESSPFERGSASIDINDELIHRPVATELSNVFCEISANRGRARPLRDMREVVNCVGTEAGGDGLCIGIVTRLDIRSDRLLNTLSAGGLNRGIPQSLPRKILQPQLTPMSD